MAVLRRLSFVERPGAQSLWAHVVLAEPPVPVGWVYPRVGGDCDLHAQQLVENRGMFEHQQLGWILAVRC